MQIDNAAIHLIAEAVRTSRHLSLRFLTLDSGEVEDAVGDAMVDVCSAEITDVDAACAKLRLAAWRNARDRARNKRHDGEHANQWVSAQAAPPTTSLEDTETLAILRAACDQICDLLPDIELRSVFWLRMQGERSTEAFASALNCTGLPSAQQRLYVKQVKDRLDKHLHRSAAIRSIAVRTMRLIG